MAIKKLIIWWRVIVDWANVNPQRPAANCQNIIRFWDDLWRLFRALNVAQQKYYVDIPSSVRWSAPESLHTYKFVYLFITVSSLEIKDDRGKLLLIALVSVQCSDPWWHPRYQSHLQMNQSHHSINIRAPRLVKCCIIQFNIFFECTNLYFMNALCCWRRGVLLPDVAFHLFEKSWRGHNCK